MNGRLFDSNVLLDIITSDSVWRPWSAAQVDAAGEMRLALMNPIIYAEVASAFASEPDLVRWLSPRIFQRLPLPFEAAWRASRAFQQYRRPGGARTSPLPDFYIGAHALCEGLALVTRDKGGCARYFPDLEIISPPPLDFTSPS